MVAVAVSRWSAVREADGRWDEFPLKGSSLAGHFEAETVGRSLCETSTWLNCDDINSRFRKILADPFASGNFYVFPKVAGQSPVADHFRYDIMRTVFQLRHSIVHNVGVVTQSDAVKFRILTR